MMTKTNIYLLPQLLMWSLFLGFFIPSVIGQNNVLDSRIDSNCILHVRLLDSTGNVASSKAPYLLRANQLQRNSNATASWQIDLSNESPTFYNLEIIDNNLTTYTDTISATCGIIVPPSSIQLAPVSAVPTFNCNSCAGSANITVTNPTGNFYTFAWSDGVTTTNTLNSVRGNLCAGTYAVVVSDSFGNHNSVSFDVLCGAPTGITCFPTVSLHLDANGQASIAPLDVRTGSTFNVNNEYFIDAQNNFSIRQNFDCSDIGYHYLTLLSRDTLSPRYDTCQVLVQILDSFNYCGASSNNTEVVDSMMEASTCNICNGYYSFDYLIRPVIGDTLYPIDLNFYWSDTSFNSSTRFDLCPNTPYLLTVVDSIGNRYEYTINVGCINNNCVSIPSIPPNSYCTDVYIPVCGCNGVTYKNACVAEYEAGVLNWSLGSCLQNTFQLNILSFPDSTACDSTSIIGSGSTFVNVSGGSGSFNYLWSDGQIGPSAINLTGGTYFLTVTDNITTSFVTRTVIIGTQGCVWPGDTDDNGVANNFDLLSIGLVYGSNGPSRSFISNNWQGFVGPFWASNSIPNIANRKHIDCNGDGVIDSLDVQAIVLNYGQSYAKSTGNSLLGTIPFYIESGVGQAGDSVKTNIILGDSINPAVDVYGLAFTINYDPAYLESDPIVIDFNNSWLGSNLIQVQKDVRNTGSIEVAVTRVDQQPITGLGPIGAVSFTIKDDLVMGRLSGDSIVSDLGISNVRLIDEQNQVIGTYLKTGNIILEENLSTPKRPTAVGISIFPNPAQEVLHLKSKSALLERVQIFTATGQLVQSIELNQVQQYSINTQAFAKGLYIIQLQTSEGIFSDKIQVSN